MSDSVTNVEIEDVLSSIRRLVSDEGRDKPRKRPQIAEQADNRLVLTPALRIAEQEADRAESAEPEAPPSLDAGFSETAETDDFAFTETADNADAPPQEAEAEEAEVAHDAPTAPDEAPALLDAAWIEQEAEVKPFVLGSPMPADETHADEAPTDEAPVEETPAEAESAEVAEDLAEDVEAEADIAAEPAPAVDADAPWSDPDATLHEAAARAAEEAFDTPEPEAAEAPAPEPDEATLPKGERMRRAAMLSAKIQALEAAIAETPEQWEPDEAGSDDYAGTEVEGMAWQPQDDDAPEQETSGISLPEEVVAETETADDTVEAEAIAEADAPAEDIRPGVEEALTEAVLAELSRDPEPVLTEDVTGADDMPPTDGIDDLATEDIAPDTADWHTEFEPEAPELATTEPETAEPEAPETLEFETPEPDAPQVVDFTVEDAEPLAADDTYAPDPALSDPAPAETVIDEDTLRDLVAQIVRQELQGALGERITRNVRKLVRREIHRAMTAQDLD